MWAAAQHPLASTPVHGGVSLIDRSTGAAAYRHKQCNGASPKLEEVEDCQDFHNNAAVANKLSAMVLPTPHIMHRQKDKCKRKDITHTIYADG